MLRAIIIDDIEAIRTKNVALIEAHCPDVKIIAQADNVANGISAIKQYLPDLVFLDIDMPDGTGFELLQRLMPVNFKVIFVTAFEDFAIKAFRFSAIDYLLKPIDPPDLVEAVRKANEALHKETLELKFGALFTNIERSSNIKKLILKTSEKMYSVNVQDIVNCESDKNYTTFYFINSPKLVVSTTLKEYETLLLPLGFFRAHQSHLINMLYFDHFIKADGGAIMMKNKMKIPLASRKKEAFMALLSN
jgi:two-component system, LytTR family, response regulator